MFAKTAVLFFAFVTFVNAVPVPATDLGLGEGPADPWNPIYGIGPARIPGVTYVSSKRGTPLVFDDPNDLKRGKQHDQRAPEGAMSGGASAGVTFSFPRDERDVIDPGSITAHVFNGPVPLGGDGISVQNQIDVVPVVQRDIVIDSQTLAQLESFVNAIVNALQANGNTQAVNTFLSQVNDLKTEVENGTLDVQDLLSAAQAIVLSLI